MPQHKNQRCFIIGGGESLRDLSEKGFDVPRLIANELTIGTNKSYLYGKSTYHVCMDLPYFTKDMANLLQQNLYVSDNIWNNSPDLKSREGINYIKRLRRTTTSDLKTDNGEHGLYYGKSSGYLAMNLARSMGCNPIYLLGIDLCGKHFHAGYGQAEDLRLPKALKVIEAEFRDGIKNIHKLGGINIVSLSNISLLNDIIPFESTVLKFYGWDACKGIEHAIGEDWEDPDLQSKLTVSGLPEDHKYRKDRSEWTAAKRRVISQFLPEYEYVLNGKSKYVLDFSTGNGTLLEVMRYLGHQVKGTDTPTCKYKPFHESQKIPMSYFDASIPPYPFVDKSFDLVSCISALNFYKCDWTQVLHEFFRIARETVFVVVNLGDDWEAKKQMLETFVPPSGWRLKYKIRSTFKWVRGG